MSVVALLIGAAPASAADPVAQHWRYLTPNGPVHVWKPAGYDRRTAGLVVYVHGFYDDVDAAFRNHRLAAQFADSKQNALFVVPEAPVQANEPVRWASLEALLDTVWGPTRLARPPGPLVVVGHSAAYRTIAGWLDDPALAQVILVDALYGNEEDYAAWLGREGGATPKRLTLVAGKSTWRWSEPFVAKLPHATVDEVPASIDALGKAERAARLLYVRTRIGHMELITDGKTLPVLLRRTALRRLP